MARSIFLLFCVMVICLGVLVMAGAIENNKLTKQVQQDKIVIDSLQNVINGKS